MQETGSSNPTAEPINEAADTGTGSEVLDDLVKKITSIQPGTVLEASVGIDMPVLRVGLESVVAVCRLLRDLPEHPYKLISDLTCVDYLDREPRFDIVYHFYSLQSHSYIRVKTGVPADPAVCPTMTDVYPGANWLEREVWDMFGIRFTDHPNLERILTPDGWEYFALRRDFPLQGPGMIKLYDSVTDVF